ncbi:hypothetical protein FRC00_013988 [Tulasnella sp. 408]|nr:hypothetical protein FRC00_013988 [Tulasnella sp. 408]
MPTSSGRRRRSAQRRPDRAAFTPGRNLDLPPNTALPGVIQQSLASGAQQQLQQGRGAAGEDQNNMGNDLLLRRWDYTPVLEGHRAVDQWLPATAGTGQFHLQMSSKPTAQQPSFSIEQFELPKVFGKGSFGTAMQVKKKDMQGIYALKTILKAHIAFRLGEITHIWAERTVLALVNNPFIVVPEPG